MKNDFEPRARDLVRSFVVHNLSIMSRNDGGAHALLGASAITGRIAAVRGANAIMNARAAAWADLSVAMHEQMKGLVDNVAIHYSLLFKQVFTTDALGYLEKRFNDATIREWLIAGELLERDRVTRALRLVATGMDDLTPIALWTRLNPMGRSNSGNSVLTITASTHVMNQAAMDIAAQAGRVTYRLWTSGEQRDPDIYKRSYEVGKGPLGPMFAGDRTIPVL